MLHKLFLLLFSLLLSQDIFCQELNLRSYVSLGEQYLGKPWDALSMTSFARYRTDGNRVEYEGQVFARRRQLASLVIAEVAEQKGRFMPSILAGIDSMLAEKWWGIPAHYKHDTPRDDDQTVDLFNAESASLLAWTGKALGEQLDAARPGMTATIGKELKRRMLIPALGTRYWWKKASMNWNPWICSNWLTCAYLYEDDATKRQQAVTEIEGCLRAFIDGYPDDGGCDEGTGYWDRAAASLFECLRLLDIMKKEGLASVTLTDYKKEKVARMGAYIYNMYIGNGYCVTFADTHENRSVVQLNVLYPFAIYLNDPQMRSLAAFIAKEKNFWQEPARLYEKSGNFPALGRELLLLSLIDQLKQEQPSEPTTTAWYPDLQVKTFRSPLNKKSAGKKGLFCAYKGGHNGENHNHNDVGSFIVYADGEPLLIDCGTGEYTDKTFSKERYTIWTMQTAYHNAPLINGYSQREGKLYAAAVMEESDNSLTLELASAYPEDAAAASWQRTITMDGEEIRLTEDINLKTLKAASRLIFITPVKPDVSRPGQIKLGKHTISYPIGWMTAGVEDISDKIDPAIEAMWGKHLYRIGLGLNSGKIVGKATLKIK